MLTTPRGQKAGISSLPRLCSTYKSASPKKPPERKKKKKQYLSTGSFTWQLNIKEEMANTLQLLQEEPGCLQKTCATLSFLSQNRSLPSITSHHHLAGSVSISPRYLTTHWRTFTHTGRSFSFLRISRQPKYQIYRQSWQPALALVDRNHISFWTFFFKKQKEQQVTTSWNSISRFERTLQDFTHLRDEQESAHINGSSVRSEGENGFCSYRVRFCRSIQPQSDAAR